MLSSNFSQLLQSFLNFLKQLFVARWRSLLLLLIGVYLPLQIFEQLAVVIWKNEGGFPWDVPLLMAIHATAKPRLDVFAATLTNFGAFGSTLSIAMAIALAFLYQKRWRSLAYLITVLVGSEIVNVTAKGLLHRVRPHLWESAYPPVTNFAFPSGHAMSSMSLVAALVILTWGSLWCWPILLFGSLYVAGIGWTRLYLGVHFPSDILAGWLVSIAWAIGVSLLIKPQLIKPTALDDEKPELALERKKAEV